MTATIMPLPQVITGSAPSLEQALADAIRLAQAEDPVAPVTVLVGGTLMRPYLQRRLATLLGGHANVALVTAGELGLQLGEPELVAQGRVPLPPLAARVLAGEVARETGGYFRPVAHTTGFTQVLHRTLRELAQAGVSTEELGRHAAALPGSADKHAALAALAAGYERRREGRYSADDCLLAADPARLASQLLVIFGVWEPTGALRRVLAGLAARVPTLVLLPDAAPEAQAGGLGAIRAWCADANATSTAAPEDERPASLLRHVQRRLLRVPLESDAPGFDGSLRLVSSPDPTREVRSAARACLAWAEQGIPFHRMALATRHADGYRPLIDAVFREAGIPVYQHEGTPLAELPLGRRVLALLDLVDANFDRRAVMDLLSDADLPRETRERYPAFSPTRWDTLTRRAGIVGGLDQWRERLTQTQADLEQRSRSEDGELDPRSADELARVTSLLAFIEDLGAAFAALPQSASFGEHLEALHVLLETYVSGVEPVLVALNSIRRLDGIAASLSFDRFRDIVRASIEGMRADAVLDRRVGAFGRRGVNVLDVNSLRHLRFDGVVLLGLVERSWPSPARQDPLLLDHERQALSQLTGAPIPLHVLGGDPEPLQFSVAVDAADRFLQASYPRADRAGGRAQLPSSFLRALASAATGAVVTAEAFDDLPAGLLRRERAAQAGPPAEQPALSAAERQRGLLEDPETAALARALLRRDERLARATDAERARSSSALTAFDGVLSPEGVAALARHWALERPMGPTALETYAGCGMRFLLGRILRVSAVEEPEALVTIDALTKGSLVHAILERFLTELGDDDWPQDARRDQHLERLRAIAQEEMEDVEARGLTGFTLLWAQERRRILEDLERWYDVEGERGRDLPERTFELRFGPARHDEAGGSPLSVDEPLELEVGGRRFLLQGRIDRLEWEPLGRFRVIDYKTGRVWKHDGDLEGGEALQLPLYTRAAAAVLGLDPARGDGEYFYVTREGGYVRVAFTADDLRDQGAALEQILDALVGGIHDGVFPARPRERRVCDRCDFDALCDQRRMPQWARKASDPRVADLEALRQESA